jgi:microcystin degradation protein MlrC
MVTELHEDAEGEILKRIRNIIGNDIPIIVTLDLHGNITQLMADNASCLIACRTYPHVDFYERSFQACHLLQKAMKKEIDLHTIIIKRAMMKGLDGGRTQIGCPLRYLIDRSEEIENRIEKDILVISICAGFSASDIYEIGPSVTVTVDRNKGNENIIKNAYDIANEFMDYTWEERMYSSVKHKCIDDAIIYAFNIANDKHIKGPLIMADVTDNPGSGHYGDSTNLLKAMIEADLPNSIFYAIYDPQAVLQAADIGVGKENTIITLGGKHDINAGGKPLILKGKIITLSEGSFPCFGPMGMHVPGLGLSMLFRVGNVDICVISNNCQLFDLAQLTSLGCDPTKKNIIAIKSNHHFRAHFEPISREIITVDGGGLGSIILNGGGDNYKYIRRPIWPLDEII